MVWARDLYGQTVLVEAEKLSAWCRKQIGILDDLTPQERARVHETGEVPEWETVTANRRVVSVGIALARPK